MKMIENYISLKKLNTFGINAHAKYFLSIQSKEDLFRALREFQSLSKLILGGGSNILFTQDFEGLVIKNEIKGIDIVEENNDYVLLNVGAGENWHDFVRYCVSKGYYGVENLSLIPGTVGAAPIQNIGAYGVELKDSFFSLEAMRISDGKIFEFIKEDCQFGYRSSIFKHSHKNQFAITQVKLKLSKTPLFNTTYQSLQERLEKINSAPLSLKLISDTIIQIREEKLPNPKYIGNAGSFFKNPEVDENLFSTLKNQYEKIPFFPGEKGVKIPAGWLIEQCGYKGKRIGDIGVHAHQALVLVNYGEGEGKAISNLAKEIAHSVKTKFAITLEPEVNII